MARRTMTARLTACVVVFGVLASCAGEGDGSPFCDRFRENAESDEFDDAAPDDPRIKEEAQRLADLAPEELQDDYEILLAAIDGERTDEAPAAVESIQSYAEDNCDVEFQS